MGFCNFRWHGRQSRVAKRKISAVPKKYVTGLPESPSSLREKRILACACVLYECQVPGIQNPSHRLERLEARNLLEAAGGENNHSRPPPISQTHQALLSSYIQHVVYYSAFIRYCMSSPFQRILSSWLKLLRWFLFFFLFFASPLFDLLHRRREGLPPCLGEEEEGHRAGEKGKGG